MALLPASLEAEDRPAREPGNPRRGKVLVSVTQEEAGKLEDWARRMGKPLAVLVRDAALRAASSR